MPVRRCPQLVHCSGNFALLAKLLAGEALLHILRSRKSVQTEIETGYKKDILHIPFVKPFFPLELCTNYSFETLTQ